MGNFNIVALPLK